MSQYLFREAVETDLTAIIALLADDQLGQSREHVSDPPHRSYQEAFQAISVDPNQLMAVAAVEQEIVGCLQLSFIPGLSRRGMWRGQFESVRIAASHRGAGLGQSMLDWALEKCRARGCELVQLTTDKMRPDAIRFYERLGFSASHEGMKLAL
ncbi:GNAT family N-acetyltransferase [Parvularcula sp. IMCC14364]|uniref:GNAT family N-acetyltransferase n=1 Tax=Parvularcula sp. IMCC14364 TaxID=3067902 RepID=UPI002740CA8F|nr:GNAT family N-acetyltransferase [Parvularcula sp. IMCC14364]